MRRLILSLVIAGVPLAACSDGDIQPPPEKATEFEFYEAVVECTEEATGIDFDPMTTDTLGFASTEAQRTINRALEEAESEYLRCFDQRSESD